MRGDQRACAKRHNRQQKQACVAGGLWFNPAHDCLRVATNQPDLANVTIITFGQLALSRHIVSRRTGYCVVFPSGGDIKVYAPCPMTSLSVVST